MVVRFLPDLFSKLSGDLWSAFSIASFSDLYVDFMDSGIGRGSHYGFCHQLAGQGKLVGFGFFITTIKVWFQANSTDVIIIFIGPLCNEIDQLFVVGLGQNHFQCNELITFCFFVLVLDTFAF